MSRVLISYFASVYVRTITRMKVRDATAGFVCYHKEVLETIDGLFSERGDEDKIWGSMVKQALKRRKPGFNESYHGFRSFGTLLEDMQKRGMLTLDHDQKSGGYIITGVL